MTKKIELPQGVTIKLFNSAFGETEDGELAFRYFNAWIVGDVDENWCAYLPSGGILDAVTFSEAVELAEENGAREWH